tara:strand:- start:111 stop:1025 length:915 start_codon:yes stop_codon:yes gene_type:complete
MKILVTGANGFIGSALSKKLLEMEQNVVGIARSHSGFLKDEILDSKKFNFLKLDLGKDNLEQLDEDIDVIVNLASQQPNNKNIDWKDFYMSNVQAIRNICKFASNRDIKQVISVSSTAVLQTENYEQYNEHSKMNPITPYGYSKCLGEYNIRKFSESKNKTQYTILRFPSVFGKNHLGGIIYTIYELASKDLNIELYDNGEKLRNLLYISDAVDSILKCIFKMKELGRFELFQVGSSNSLKMNEITQIIIDKVDSKSKVIPIEKPTNQNNISLNLSKLNNQLDFKTMSIKEGIDLYIKEKQHEI